MINLFPHRSFHVPNALAALAAALLIVTSMASPDNGEDAGASSQSGLPPAQIETGQDDGIGDPENRGRRALNLGLLLFRRG